MAKNGYSFKVGNLECLAISDGDFFMSHHQVFPNTQISLVEQLLRKNGIEPGEIPTTATCLLIRTGDELILIDTGFGVDFAPTTGKLIENLQAEGIKPADIDMVIVSHAHLDHMGGNADVEGKPIFPKARYIVTKEDWNFWTWEPNLADLPQDRFTQAQIAAVRKNLLPIQDRFDAIDYGTEILPGIKVMAAPGHTPGHTVLDISSDNERLLCTFDVAHFPFQLEQPDWYFSGDIDKEQAVITRHEVLNGASADKVLVMASHFPFPGLGYIMKDGETWTWQPIELRG